MIKYICEICGKEVEEERYIQILSQLYSDNDTDILAGVCRKCDTAIRDAITSLKASVGKQDKQVKT